MKKIGFILNYDENEWAGGINYIRSLIAAIYENKNRLVEPVVIIGRKSTVDEKYFFPSEIIRTKCLDKGNLFWYLRKVIIKLMKYDYYMQWILLKNDIKIISHSGYLGKNSCITSICWIPDFQHNYLSDNFLRSQVISRNEYNKKMCDICDAVILSSYDALNDLNKFIPGYDNKAHVLQFVPIPNNNINWLSLEKLQEIYKFNTPFFLLPAQFWIHKNHQVVLDALKIMSHEENNFKIIATGSTQDPRQLNYFQDLLNCTEETGVTNNIIFTGHIPYNHMISLMKYSLAVINPSLFEGWSTIVEEAKSLGKIIVLSDIGVHREQNPEYAHYFNPKKPEKLAEILNQITIKQDSNFISDINENLDKTNVKRLAFGKAYLDIIETLASKYRV